MISNLIARARANPRTTLAGLAKLLLGLGSVLETMHTGQVWPAALGLCLYLTGDFIQALLAGDATTAEEDAAKFAAAVEKLMAEAASKEVTK